MEGSEVADYHAIGSTLVNLELRRPGLTACGLVIFF